MDFLLNGFGREANVQIPTDIINLLISFYMYDLKAYEFIALFLSDEEKICGHFTAFNMTKDKHCKEEKPTCEIRCSDKKITREELGTTVKLFSLSSFPDHIKDNLYPKYKHVDCDLHVLIRVEGETEKLRNVCTAYLIETDESFQLPFCYPSIDRCGFVVHPEHGLIALGGYDFLSATAYSTCNVLTLGEDASSFHWSNNVMPSMNAERSNQGCLYIEDSNLLFSCGGWTNTTAGDTNSVEIYNFNASNVDGDGWKYIRSMNHAHICHGIVNDSMDTKRTFIVGGIRSHQSQKVEQYDAIKNVWVDLPNTLYPHKWFPDIKIENNVLSVTGNHYGLSDITDWGCSEYLDLRDSSKKWQRAYDKSIQDIIFGETREYSNHKMRGIWSI